MTRRELLGLGAIVVVGMKTYPQTATMTGVKALVFDTFGTVVDWRTSVAAEVAALAKHGGLPWDVILGAELVRHYKPDREVYQSAADILDLQPAEVMMVAAHLGDLRAAKGVGLKTAFVTRPLEYGPEGKPDLKADASVDVSAKDFNDLAAQLGA